MFKEIPFLPGFISPSESIQYSLISIRIFPLKSRTLTYLIFPIWNMLSSLLLLLCLEDASALEVSPGFCFFTGFSGTACFFLFNFFSTSLSESLPEELEETSSFDLGIAPLRPTKNLSLSATFRCFPLFRPACLQLPPRPAAPAELAAGHGAARGVTGPASWEARAGGARVPRRAVHEACRPPAWTPREQKDKIIKYKMVLCIRRMQFMTMTLSPTFLDSPIRVTVTPR